MGIGAEIIIQYFPDLTSVQQNQFASLGELYLEWNSKINVISRKDMDSLYPKHILHSLAISKYTSFVEGSGILDLGTGGGLPGIPLAIVNPEVQFLLIDARAKKISVVNEIIEELGLDNVRGIHKRAEDVKMKFDFVLARAVTRLDKLIELSMPLIHQEEKNILPNGLITLKGGDLTQEIKAVSKQHQVEQVSVENLISEPIFHDKYILYVQA